MCRITQRTAVVELIILFADTACPFRQPQDSFLISIIHEISFMYRLSSSLWVWKHKMTVTIFLSILERILKLHAQIILIHFLQSQCGRHVV